MKRNPQESCQGQQKIYRPYYSGMGNGLHPFFDPPTVLHTLYEVLAVVCRSCICIPPHTCGFLAAISGLTGSNGIFDFAAAPVALGSITQLTLHFNHFQSLQFKAECHPVHLGF